MNIELKNLKISASLSEETTAYTATIYVDGKPAFHASNHGHGGCDAYYPIEPFTHADLERVTAWAAEQTGETFEPLDLYIGNLIEDQERAKRLDRMLKSKIVILGTNKGQPAIFTYPAKYKPTPENLARVPVKAGEAVLNTRPDLRETALALV